MLSDAQDKTQSALTRFLSADWGAGLIAGRLALVRGLARIPLAILPLVILGANGATPETDCFFLVYSGAMFATASLAPLLETVVVPFVAQARISGREEAFVKAVFVRAGAMFVPISVGLAVAAGSWSVWHPTTAPGWQDGWKYLLVLSVLPLLNALASVLSGFLNASEWFMAAAIAAGVRGFVPLFVGLAAASRLGVFAYAVGIAAGELGALIFLASAGPSPRVLRAAAAHDSELTSFWRLFRAAAAGGLANSSKGFVDRFIAASMGAGAVSIIEGAERVFLMAVSFLGTPFATVVLSRWSSAFPDGASESVSDLLETVRRGQRIAALLGCVVMIGVPLVAVLPAWNHLFARFTVTGAAGWALVFYAIGAVPYLLGLVTTQGILVLRDSRFVAGVTVLIALLNAPLDLIGIWALGLPGIALGSSVLHLVGFLAAEYRFRYRAAT